MSRGERVSGVAAGRACGATADSSLRAVRPGVRAGASHPPGLVVSVWLDFGRDIHHEACCCSPIALSGECLYRLREGHSPRGGGGAREARPEDAWGVTARDGARQEAGEGMGSDGTGCCGAGRDGRADARRGTSWACVEPIHATGHCPARRHRWLGSCREPATSARTDPGDGDPQRDPGLVLRRRGTPCPRGRDRARPGAA